MPAYNETLGLVGSGGKYTTKWQTDQGLNMDQEFESLRAEIQAIWDKQQWPGSSRTGPDDRSDPARHATGGVVDNEAG